MTFEIGIGGVWILCGIPRPVKSEYGVKTRIGDEKSVMLGVRANTTV